ncbi:MAG: hypothetical protein SPI12_02630 [Actinomycetaceae bacterium]|nr:hypothetical protein [Actinomycetaceae bacterium]MDY6082744.1 hypothetical protein [Actinomycetaceae bacterium]
MRIYIPAVSTDLPSPEVSSRVVYCVTPQLVRLFPDEDSDVLEAIAFTSAVDASLDALVARRSEAAAARRIVIAADVPDGMLASDVPEEEPETARLLAEAVSWDRVVSLHIDGDDVQALVAQAVSGNADALHAVEEEDLLWFDVAERTSVIAHLRSVSESNGESSKL